MKDQLQVTADFSPTPEQLAAAFWNMDSGEQADFFAALDYVAGFKLCFQMASVVDEIRIRADQGNRDAQNGFQTMLAHAQGYAESATDYRVWAAQREIRQMADNAKVPA